MSQATVEKYSAVGRRKEAVACVRLMPGTGKFIINHREFAEYIPIVALQNMVLRPLELTNHAKSFDIAVRTKGGGVAGQAGAIRHGISRALLKVSADLRPILKKEGFLTRDPRMKERKKPGQPGARKRFQFSKR